MLPYRSNIPEISKFSFSRIDESFYERSRPHQKQGFFIIGGRNYGQGSSREHAVLGPRYLGLKVIIAKSFARIHWQNLCNFGILSLVFSRPEDYDRINRDDVLVLAPAREAVGRPGMVELFNRTQKESYHVANQLSSRQIENILAGSLINAIRNKLKT